MTRRKAKTGRSGQPRLSSGIARLDEILEGGVIQGGTYVLLGPSGSGKTIMANQICCQHIAHDGGRCVYVSLLAESHGRLIAHLEGMRFFRREYVPDRLFFISGYQSVRGEGLPGLLRLLRSAVQERNASILVVDGLESVREDATNGREFGEFLHQLQAFTSVTNCTTFLVSLAQSHGQEPERVLADGVIELGVMLAGPRAVRELMVSKLRGSSYLAGKHELEIDDAGILVHPRTEVRYTEPMSLSRQDRVRMGFGMPRLDEMLGGGPRSGSVVALLGAPGTGKTLAGLSFLLNGARRGQPGIYFGFREPPPRLLEKAEALGLDLARYVDDGLVRLLWQAPLESALDALAERLLERVEPDPAPRTRLFIDGIAGFRAAAAYPDRMGNFLAALCNRLRLAGVTAVVSDHLPPLQAGAEPTGPELVHVAETAILLRHARLHSQCYRLISIMKMQESDYDTSVREFRISANGIDAADVFGSADDALSPGLPHGHSEPPAERSVRRSR
jgi:circadian clock protein KaiC